METIITKIIICSGILLGLYHLILAKEKTLVFNRFHLIFSLIFSIAIPFFSIQAPEIRQEKTPLVFEEALVENVVVSPEIPSQTIDYNQILLYLYILITVVLFVKMIVSFINIKKLKGKKIIYQNRLVVLMKKDIAPFSFWNTIYVSEKSFSEGKINEQIFLHEEIHIKQKHTIDLLLAEVVKVILWFNPFVYFYKKAIVGNHEFLADQEVISKNKNIKNDQELILEEVLKQQSLSLTHQFNFNNTKKRFIMMTKQNSKFAKAKRFLAIPVFAIAVFAFAEKVYGNNSSNTPKLGRKNQNLIVSKSVHSDRKFYINSAMINKNSKTDTIVPKKTVDAKIVNIKDDGKKEKRVTDIAVGQPYSTKETIPPPPPPSATFVQAEFPGGIDNLRQKITQNFNSSQFKGQNGYLKSNCYIVIDEKGNVEKVVADGENELFNKEVERTLNISMANTQWKPATNQGASAKTTFRFPIAMTFAN